MPAFVIDKQTYQAYANIAEQHNISVTDAMMEALLLLKQHFKKVAKSSLRNRLKKRIEELQALSVNWDCAGSPAISPIACGYASKVLEACSDKLLKGLAIFPNTNGNILMQWKTAKGDACLSILSDRLVYDINYGEEEKEGVLPFSEISEFVNILRNIA